MPKIAAPTIEQHVNQQQERILHEALNLFRANGYARVDLGAIADAVGLKRNSVYRYFANKDELLVTCVEYAMTPLVQRNRAIAEGFRPPMDRVMAWVDAQYHFATGPDHAFYTLAQELRVLAPDVRNKVLKLHVGLYKTLSAAVKDCLSQTDRNAITVSSLIAGMVQSAAALAMENGGVAAIKDELRAAVLSVINATPSSQHQPAPELNRRTSS